MKKFFNKNTIEKIEGNNDDDFLISSKSNIINDLSINQNKLENSFIKEANSLISDIQNNNNSSSNNEDNKNI